MSPDLPILRSLLVHPHHQIPSRSSVRSNFQVPVGPMVLSPNYGYRQKRLGAPRKMRTVYTREQKDLLQRYFAECTYPKREERRKLALLIGVTAHEIQVCLSSLSLTAEISNLPTPNQTPELGAL